MEASSEKRTTAGQRRVVAVVGAPRSGTSAMAHALECLGVDMGDPRLHRPADKENERGFWEDQRIIDLCSRLLASQGLNWNSLRLVSASDWLAPGTSALLSQVTELVTECVSHARGGIWGCKNPQMSRTIAVWAEAFRRADCRASYVVAIRNPLSFAASVTRGSPHFGTGEAPTHLYLTWLVYTLGSLEPAIGGDRAVLVDYDNLVANPRSQLARISRDLDLPITSANALAVNTFCADFMEKGLRHASFKKDDLYSDAKVPTIVEAAYRLLSSAAADNPSLFSDEFRDQWNEIAATARASNATFSLIDQMEGQLLRSRALGRFIYRNSPQLLRRWLARFA